MCTNVSYLELFLNLTQHLIAPAHKNKKCEITFPFYLACTIYSSTSAFAYIVVCDVCVCLKEGLYQSFVIFIATFLSGDRTQAQMRQVDSYRIANKCGCVHFCVCVGDCAG